MVIEPPHLETPRKDSRGFIEVTENSITNNIYHTYSEIDDFDIHKINVKTIPPYDV